MASGLIYLIILGMWGAYFIPRWISQHDSASGRATQRYKSAMKVVASTPNIPDVIDRDVKLRQLRLRQLITAALGVLVFLTASLALAGVFSFSFILIPLSATAIYFVHIRRQVVAAALKKRRLQALAQITAAEVKRDPSVRISLSPRTESNDHWIPLSERITDRTESGTITVIPREDIVKPSVASATWSPVEVPKPTYVTAPKAIRSQRTIDLTVPGAWSAEQERLAALAEPVRDQLFDQELFDQELFDQEALDQAVNE